MGSRELRWVAGVPSLQGSYVRQTGGIREFGFEKTWGFDEDGQLALSHCSATASNHAASSTCPNDAPLTFVSPKS